MVDEGRTMATVAPDRRVIRASDVAVIYGLGRAAVHALGPLSLDIREGEFVSLVGPSGCGKSTFVKAMAGLVELTAGRIELTARGPRERVTATVFQDYGIFPWKTVRANVEFGVRVTGGSRQQAKAAADTWLKRLGLFDFVDAYPATLSGGMRQRVAIARALAVEPEILLMDEPFASLDAQLREILQEELLNLCQTDRRTVLFVTHSLEEALVLSDRVVVMTARPGRVLEDQLVPFPRPRTAAIREAPEFGQLRMRLWDHLRAEVQAQLAAQSEVDG